METRVFCRYDKLKVDLKAAILLVLFSSRSRLFIQEAKYVLSYNSQAIRDLDRYNWMVRSPSHCNRIYSVPTC